MKWPSNKRFPFPPGGLVSKNKDFRFVLRDGDIFRQKLPDGQMTPFMITSERESNLGFAHGDSVLTFQKNNNLFSLNLLDGTLRQITNFTDIKMNVASPKNTAEKWLEKEQLELFEVLEERRTHDLWYSWR